MTDNLNQLFSLEFPYAHGAPTATADFRSTPEDFVVDEDLGFEPDMEGEHLLLHLRKRGENTVWIAEQLAGSFGVHPMDVGYCGMKDRHAVTSQWFSLYLPKMPADEQTSCLQAFAAKVPESVSILAQAKHRKKLRRGQHLANRFELTLRNISDLGQVTERLERVMQAGVPNYFGEQRFGRNGSNLYWAQRWFGEGETIRSRNKKVMAKSAARAYLFNLVLAHRIEQCSWNQYTEGEWATGPLWGRGRLKINAEQAEQEQALLSPWQTWLEGLEHVGLLQERRALVLHPQNLSWQFPDEATLVLIFSLPPGAFATSVLRELVVLNNVAAVAETVDEAQ